MFKSFQSFEEEFRNDKKYFSKQLLSSKKYFFCKKIPVWASDFNKLSEVVKIQYRQARLTLDQHSLTKIKSQSQIIHSWGILDEIKSKSQSEIFTSKMN